jgi:hypothetical protein
VAQTSEDQAIRWQRPHIAKDPRSVSDFKKHTAGPIEENIDGAIGFKCSACIFQWV